MRTPFDPTDPLLQSLTEEAADLPRKAAGEARRTRELGRRRRRQIVMTATALFCGMCAWQVIQPMNTGRESIGMQELPDAPLKTAHPSREPDNHLIVRTEEQARNEPLPLPEGLTREQENVVKAARGLPLVLVRDNTGKVSRIHVIER